MSESYVELPVENIIKESQTTRPELCGVKYVIYLDEANRGKKVRVNTYYHRSGDKLKLYRYYDSGLCDTLEEYENLDLDYIEGQAYNAYMNGAR